MDAAATGSRDRIAGAVAAGIAGGLLGVAGTLAAAVATRGRPHSVALAPRLLLAASASAGVALLADRVTGSRAGARLADATWGNRHKAAFAAGNLHRPHVVLAAHHAARDSRAMERHLFGPGVHGDDGIDALRHAYASGLLAARLMHDHGMSAEAAVAVVDAAGRAHERDADHEDRHVLSSPMDLHNNAAGARVGVAVAASGSAEAGTVFDGVVAALDEGRLRVIDHGGLRRASRDDLPSR